MNIFRSSKAQTTAQTSNLLAVEVQTKPAIFTTLAGSTCFVKIDRAYQVGTLAILVGWRSTNVRTTYATNKQPLKITELKHPRPDVAANLNVSENAITGFNLIAQNSTLSDLRLEFKDEDGTKYCSSQLKTLNEITESDLNMFSPEAIPFLLPNLNITEEMQRHLLSKCPVSDQNCQSAAGHLEGAAALSYSKSIVIVGWEIHTPETIIWLEDESGNIYPLEPQFRRFRKDVSDVMKGQFGHLAQNSAFIFCTEYDTVPEKLTLKALSDKGTHALSSIAIYSLPDDPNAVARWLFAIETHTSEFHKRTAIIDEPLIRPLMELRRQHIDALKPEIQYLGALPKAPQVSIIIPLYGRTDFVEHQLIEFAKDEWLLENAEIIYVLDDPDLTANFTVLAEYLHRLYKIGFSWVGGDVNRGFSGANNLGVTFAKGKYLNFLNSDAFPQQPGWLQALIQCLEQNPDLGAVGPRLTFADGGIQYAGMEFVHKPELGIWINHHSNMGLDICLDPNNELTRVPAATGACLVMEREEFDRVGQWDTGYLIGDFEDSDLCLKLRDSGKTIGYLPSVQLTHLERQSFKLLGQDDFRTKVVLFNALRHQARWAHLLHKAD